MVFSKKPKKSAQSKDTPQSLENSQCLEKKRKEENPQYKPDLNKTQVDLRKKDLSIQEEKESQDPSPQLVLYPSWSHNNSALSGGNANTSGLDEPPQPIEAYNSIENILKNTSVLLSDCSLNKSQSEYQRAANKKASRDASLLGKSSGDMGTFHAAHIVFNFNDLMEQLGGSEPEKDIEKENSFEISKKEPPVRAIELISQRNFSISLYEQLNQVEDLSTDEKNMLKIMEFKFK